MYEYVESSAGAAIVMELIDGVSLREILAHQGATTAEAALVVLQGSLMGLAAAHRRSVVHRDYKPENVLVNGDGSSKLTDFGLAARAGDRPVAAGTLPYMAPEQIDGGAASPATDVHAATATFYECLTGHPPFSGEPDELLRQHHAAPVPLDPLPAPLRPLVTAGMAKDPTSRPADAITFVAELGTVASGAYGRDWERRGRSQLGEAALLLAALWPSGGPPAEHGAAAHRIPPRRYLRARHLGPVKAAIAVGVAIATVAAGAALAAAVSDRHGGGSATQAAVTVPPITLGRSPSTSPPLSPSSTLTPPSAPAPPSTPTPSAPTPTATPPAFDFALFDWDMTPNEPAATVSQTLTEAASDLSSANDPAWASAISELNYLASLPPTGVAPGQALAGEADMNALDEFFHTPGLTPNL
jgi:eukaryotic-like serine/threonine-protein kinase